MRIFMLRLHTVIREEKIVEIEALTNIFQLLYDDYQTTNLFHADEQCLINNLVTIRTLLAERIQD